MEHRRIGFRMMVRVGQRIIRACDRILDVLVDGSNVLVAVLVIFMMLSTVADAFMRYVFNDPIGGVMEINYISVPAMTFLCWAGVQKYGGHVNVELVIRHLRTRTRLIVLSAGYILAMVFLAAMGYMGLQDAIRAFAANEVIWGGRMVPIWPARFIVPAGCWLLCLYYIKEIWNNLTRWQEEKVFTRKAV